MNAVQFKEIFKTGNIGNMQLRNRLIMTAMGTRLTSETMGVTERIIDHYSARAKGGVSLIITECAFVAGPGGIVAFPRLSVESTGYIPGLNRLCEAVHYYGAKIAIQLLYPEVNPDGIELGPSNISASLPLSELAMTQPRPMTTEEIQTMVSDMIRGAQIAKMAGADAVQIHAAHGHIIGQFLSPVTNRRSDRYGGSTETRAQVVVDMIRGMKQELGNDFPVLIKFNHTDYVPGGIEIEEAKVLAELFVKAGADALEPSAGLTGLSMDHMIQPIYLPKGYNMHKVSEITKSIDVPVIAVGSITNPQMANQIIAEGKADFVALGRPLLADPDFASKAEQGDFDDIRPCIRCCEGCVGRVRKLFSIGCTVNADVGEERTSQIECVDKSKNVLIIGGGPAGMEAARVAALRGHNVTICEKERELGGALLVASLAPNKEEIDLFKAYLINQLNKLKVDIRLNDLMTLEKIKEISPDAIVVATGTKPVIPDIPGVDLEIVSTAKDVLQSRINLGKKVVIIGGGLVGCETAYKLYEDGLRDITIIEILESLMSFRVPELPRITLLRIINQSGIRIMTSTYVVRITEKGVEFINKSGERGEIGAENVIIATGNDPENSLAKELDIACPVYTVGDCDTPGTIYSAIHGGSFVGREL